jgi:hypothetical protein
MSILGDLHFESNGKISPITFFLLSLLSAKGDSVRDIDQIQKKIEELKEADLDKMVTDEVEYGKFWLEWVLGKVEHTTIMKKKVSHWWPIAEGRAMNSYGKGEGGLYYVVLGEDFLRDTCQTCKKINNMKFGWKMQQDCPLFVCTNIAEIQPTISQPIKWNSRLSKGAECPSYEKSS